MGNTYSFIDVSASLTGPTGSIDLGYGSANSEEGITVTMTEAKNTMTVGADGEVMHSLHAGKSGTITVTLLKTSPVNKKLSLMYNAQSQSSAETRCQAISPPRAAAHSRNSRITLTPKSAIRCRGYLTPVKLTNCWGSSN